MGGGACLRGRFGSFFICASTGAPTIPKITSIMANDDLRTSFSPFGKNLNIPWIEAETPFFGLVPLKLLESAPILHCFSRKNTSLYYFILRYLD
jgi:hypothetical protein